MLSFPCICPITAIKRLITIINLRTLVEGTLSTVVIIGNVGGVVSGLIFLKGLRVVLLIVERVVAGCVSLSICSAIHINKMHRNGMLERLNEGVEVFSSGETLRAPRIAIYETCFLRLKIFPCTFECLPQASITSVQIDQADCRYIVYAFGRNGNRSRIDLLNFERVHGPVCVWFLRK